MLIEEDIDVLFVQDVHTTARKIKYIKKKFKGYHIFYCIKNRQQLQNEYTAGALNKINKKYAFTEEDSLGHTINPLNAQNKDGILTLIKDNIANAVVKVVTGQCKRYMRVDVCLSSRQLLCLWNVYAPPHNSDNNKFFAKFSTTLDKLVARNGAKSRGFKSFLAQQEFKNVKSQAGTIAQATRIDTWIGGPEVQVIDANILDFDRKLSPDHARISLSIEVPGTNMQLEETGNWWVPNMEKMEELFASILQVSQQPHKYQ